jgi:hypothetical protein
MHFCIDRDMIFFHIFFLKLFANKNRLGKEVYLYVLDKEMASSRLFNSIGKRY